MTTHEVQKTERFWDSLEVLDKHHWISNHFKGRGDLEFAGQLRFKGIWDGFIFSKEEGSHLFVMRESVVRGRLRVKQLSVEGELADVDVETNCFHALSGSRVSGAIRAKIFVIDEGAIVQARMTSLR